MLQLRRSPFAKGGWDSPTLTKLEEKHSQVLSAGSSTMEYLPRNRGVQMGYKTDFHLITLP